MLKTKMLWDVLSQSPFNVNKVNALITFILKIHVEDESNL